MSAISDSAFTTSYSLDVVAALASAATLIAICLVVYFLFRATYLVIRIFTTHALLLATALFLAMALIGWLNR